MLPEWTHHIAVSGWACTVLLYRLSNYHLMPAFSAVRTQCCYQTCIDLNVLLFIQGDHLEMRWHQQASVKTFHVIRNYVLYNTIL